MCESGKPATPARHWSHWRLKMWIAAAIQHRWPSARPPAPQEIATPHQTAPPRGHSSGNSLFHPSEGPSKQLVERGSLYSDLVRAGMLADKLARRERF